MKLERIGRSCQSKHDKPSMRVVRMNLEELARRLQIAQ